MGAAWRAAGAVGGGAETAVPQEEKAGREGATVGAVLMAVLATVAGATVVFLVSVAKSVGCGE